MAGLGKIRRVFPGGNTSYGFYSFYDNILPQEEASRIFILKGGPGTGKSTFMTRIAEDMVKLGLDVECHQCSSDNGSLDGIVIPSARVAIIDGTAPHIVDPKNPGAVDEIVNLGEYFNESRLSAAKEEILHTTKRISRLFRTAYSLLKEGKVAYDEWKSYVKESMDLPRYNEILNALIDKIFEGVHDRLSSMPKHRHLFASAITPGGLVNFADTLINSSMKSYAIEGEPGSGVKELISRIAQAAFERGLSTEEFHCPFEPDLLDMLIIPEINTVLINTSKPLHYNIPKVEGLRVEDRINLNICIQKELPPENESELEDAKKRFYALIAAAIDHISQAKSTHDALEEHYVNAMDFTKVEEKRQEILNRILKYVP